MKKWTKWVCLLLAVAMFASLSAGCAGGTSDSSNDVSTGQEDKEGTKDIGDKDGGDAAKDQKELPPYNDKGVPTWKYEKDPYEIGWYINFNWYNYNWDPETVMLPKLIKEECGITVDVMVGNDDKLNALIASNSEPDVLTMNWSAPQFDLLQSSGRLWDLQELIDQHAPSFNNIYPKSMKEWYTYEDGKWYGFANNFMAPEKMTEENYVTVNTGVWARKDLMDQIGVKPEDFSTQDGFVEACKKFKDSGIKTKDGQTIYPVLISEKGGVGHTFAYLLPKLFAIPLEDKDGNYQHMWFHPKYLEMMKFANRLFRDGLIAMEMLTMDNKQLDEIRDTGRGFVSIETISELPGQILDKDPSVEIIPVPPVRAKDGGEPIIWRDSVGWTVSVITKNSKRPDKCIQFFEWLYDDPGMMFMYFGIEGEHYTLGSDGHIVLTDLMKEYKSKGWKIEAAELGTGRWWWVNNPALEQRRKPEAPTRRQAAQEALRLYYGQWAYPTNVFAGLDPKGGSDETIIRDQCQNYWDEQIIQMLMAKSEEEVEKIYNDSVAHVKELGFDRVVEIMNENFQKNKKRLGVEEAWPADRK